MSKKNKEFPVKRRELSHDKVRVTGEKGSQQNKLRQQLYSNVSERLKQAYNNGYYFEVIALCDMIITDRIEAYIQYLVYEDDSHYETSSIGLAIQVMGKARNEKGLVADEEYSDLYKLVASFANDRNNALHRYLLVRNDNSELSLDERLELLKSVAKSGMAIAKLVKNWTRRQIKL